MSGNVFSNTVPFDQKQVPKINKIINKILNKVGAKALPIGSGASPTPGKMSGDLDVIVDADALANHFQSIDIKDVRQQLRTMFSDAGFDTAQSGVSVHVKVEIKGEFHQVDIMIVKNAKQAAKFHTHNIPDNSPYKGAHKHMMLSALAREQNLLWSPYEGLFTRDNNGKKNKLLTDNLDDIANTLLGTGAKGSDLSSVESMLSKLPKNRADSVIQKLTQDLNWNKSLKTESLQVRKLKQLSGLI
jgi:hypothetical protein